MTPIIVVCYDVHADYPEKQKRIKMAAPALSEDNLDILLNKMYKEKGWDFRHYRRSSLKRCIERMLISSRLPYHQYVDLLDSQPSEFNNLFKHITIKVSGFFRDFGVFNHIEKDVIPVLLERLRSEERDMLRVWSCGCARGEEGYSMAMLLSKVKLNLPSTPFNNRGEPKRDFNVKIFATDIDEGSINIARKGSYIAEYLKDVDPILRDIFFMPVDHHYQAGPLIRNLITFGVHNIVSDIHLSHMDIILCRNLLIYFEKDLQEKVFEKLYYSLNKGGFIILGRSEVMPSLYRNRFREVFRKEKIYQKI